MRLADFPLACSCGHQSLNGADSLPATLEDRQRQKRRWRRINWGDVAARLLSYVGITQPRMVAVFGKCGCKERQKKLNQIGWEWSDRWKRLAKWFT
jgi:hypothetical protein